MLPQGVTGGVVLVDVTSENTALIWELARFLGRLEAEGHRWIAMGIWSMQADVLEFGWIPKLGAHIVQPGVNTCRQGKGSCIDYHIVCKGLAR